MADTNNLGWGLEITEKLGLYKGGGTQRCTIAHVMELAETATDENQDKHFIIKELILKGKNDSTAVIIKKKRNTLEGQTNPPKQEGGLGN